VQFAVFVALGTGWAGIWFPKMLESMRFLLVESFRVELSVASLHALLLRSALPIATGLLIGGGVVVATMAMAQFAVTGFGLATAKIAPDLGRLNPISNLTELPARNRRAFTEAVLLLPIFLGICWAIISANLESYLRLPLMAVPAGAALVAGSLSSLLWKASAVLLVWGGIDLFRQRRRYQNDLKMTKQEIREEFKQNEGTPEVKMKIRRMRRELLRRRMMAEVPTATAVIVNPTHFAVALRYDMHAMAAPKVVAKGKNFLALRIREKALAHQVPVIENPPLAQALYKQVEVGQEIPAHLYRVVAEVLAYVFRLMRGRQPGA
jgi:flagellar biosynthetic protein FlhB